MKAVSIDLNKWQKKQLLVACVFHLGKMFIFDILRPAINLIDFARSPETDAFFFYFQHKSDLFAWKEIFRFTVH